MPFSELAQGATCTLRPCAWLGPTRRRFHAPCRCPQGSGTAPSLAIHGYVGHFARVHARCQVLVWRLSRLYFRGSLHRQYSRLRAANTASGEDGPAKPGREDFCCGSKGASRIVDPFLPRSLFAALTRGAASPLGSLRDPLTGLRPVRAFRHAIRSLRSLHSRLRRLPGFRPARRSLRSLPASSTRCTC